MCGFCGTALAAPLAAQEVRKTVSIVFSDLAGSTSLGEKLDPEALREVLGRYFDVMKAVLEEHGGTVEKYIGDAIMAVFGLPTVHEDDALRAVRAADGMKRALATLNDELDRVWGVRIINRTGVNTGEVVAGDAATMQRLVTGDAVNVAARLEQAAPPLEVLLGEPTYRLVRDVVEVEAVPPLELKGKAKRVPAYRLISVESIDAGARQRLAPIVGRERELSFLQSEFRRAVDERVCRFAVVLGEAGVGKSRLAEEMCAFVAEEASVFRGRCLPYGKGNTFWPILELVQRAASIARDDPPELARTKLFALLPEAEDALERVASAIGLSDVDFSIDEVFWGIRKLLEGLARERPLLVVLDDIHWAATTFLDLIEHLNQRLKDGPIVLLCLARPDLDDIRPEWTSGPVLRMELEPLSDEESALIVRNLLGEAGLADDVQGRIIRAAEGNPLFVEQMLSMLIDNDQLRQENGTWAAAGDLSELSVPPTIQALIGARLDLLTREERAVIEPASVIGFQFPHAALEELVPDAIRGSVHLHLASLSRKQLIRVDAAAPTESGGIYRFHHILIRDAAYQTLLKRTRATLHERFVGWAERVNRDRDRETEWEEILGFHLEQAHQYLAELGPLDAHGSELGVRASERLSSAGRKAFARNDMAAAANLLRRAVQLLPEHDPQRLRLLPPLGEALIGIGELAWAELFLDEAAAAAAENADEQLHAEATLVRLLLQRYTQELDRWTTTVLAEASRAIEIFEPTGDHRRLANAWRFLMNAHAVAYRFGELSAAAERAAEHARLAGDTRLQTGAAMGIARAAFSGPTPVPQAIARCEELLARASGDKSLEGVVLCLLAPLRAMQGEFDTARDLYARGRATLDDIGGKLTAAFTTFNLATVEMLAGEPSAAEQALRREYEALERIGEKYLRPTIAAELAAALAEQGRYREAEEFSRAAEELAADDDVISQALWRSTRARILAHGGDFEAAISLAQEAADLLATTEGLVRCADALMTLGEVLQQSGQRDAAANMVSEALGLYDRKGHEVAARAARTALAEIQTVASSLEDADVAVDEVEKVRPDQARKAVDHDSAAREL